MNFIEFIAHTLRRSIIESLDRNELSFSELLRCTSIRKNHGKLGYHLKKLMLINLVEQVPSTKKYRLTEEGFLASEMIWDINFLVSEQIDFKHEPARYVRHLRLGDHAVLYYDTEDIKREITFPFILSGLLKTDAVVYLASEDKLDSESREIQRHGINADRYPKGAFTIMSSDEWYIRKGKAQAEIIISNWQALVKEKQKDGFMGLHVTGDLECFFENEMSKELLSYDAALGRQLSLNLCRLCLYDTHRLNENLFAQLNKSHGHLIFKGIAMKTI